MVATRFKGPISLSGFMLKERKRTRYGQRFASHGGNASELVRKSKTSSLNGQNPGNPSDPRDDPLRTQMNIEA